MMTLVLFVLIFGVVVIAHEFGHFLFAKLHGIRVVEFAVGMGPNIFSFKKGETKYSLKLFPIGGACMFEGEDGLKANDGEEFGESSFIKASLGARMSTVVAGPVFNFLLAGVVAFVMVNMMIIREPIYSEVVPGSASQEAGMLPGDRILSLNGERIKLFDEISLYLMTTYRGGDIQVKYERDGEVYMTTLTPKYSEEQGQPLLGIANAQYVDLKGFDAFRFAWYEVRLSFKATVKSLSMLFRGQVSREDVAGPVGIANVVGQTYENAKEYGWQTVLLRMLNIVLMLSVNLGIMNLLPIPALDGGRLLFMLIELVRGKPIPPEKEGIVHFIGLIFLMALMVFVFFNDLVNIFM